MTATCGQHTALLIGVGNEFREDDALGILVAREIHRRNPDSVRVIEASGEGASLMDAWTGTTRVILVDAVFSGSTPGTIHRLDAGTETIPRSFFRCSSHDFGVAEAIEMGRQLAMLPDNLVIYGIEGKEFGTGVGLSDPVVRCIPELIAMIEEDLHAFHPS